MTHKPCPQMNSIQKQVLYGTILGGSSLIKPKKGKNCYLSMRDQDVNWLMYKAEELHDLFKMDENVLKKDKHTCRCYSITSPVFNETYEFFYPEGEKIITREMLDRLELTSVAWMVWFVDSGRKSKRRAYLRTQKFGEKGTEAIADYFNSLNCECDVHTCRGRYEILFSNQGAYTLLNTIVHRMPKFILEKYD